MPSEEPLFPRIQVASDHSLLVTFSNRISRADHAKVARLFSLLHADQDPAIMNIHPAYSSVLISFDPLAKGPEKMEAYLRSLLLRIRPSETESARVVEIPVCYEPPFGPDLEFVASHNKMTPESVVHLHTSTKYLVYFLGFAPGFPYMGELPKQLETPRLASPRVEIPAGSVAIGGSQTGIYPIASPGGWRIIGRTPLEMFNPNNVPPTFLTMGDLVQFRTISSQEFQTMRSGVQ